MKSSKGLRIIFRLCLALSVLVVFNVFRSNSAIVNSININDENENESNNENYDQHQQRYDSGRPRYNGSIRTTAQNLHSGQPSSLRREDSINNTNKFSIANCFTEGCARHLALQMARVWPDRSDRAWAASYPKPMKDSLKRGILLVKVPKTASTTSAAVALRLSKRHDDIPVLYQHALPSLLRYKYRHATESYLFSSVRHPEARAMSFLWYHFSRLQQPHNESVVLQQLHEYDDRIQDGADARMNGRGGFQLAYLSLDKIPPYSIFSKSNFRITKFDAGNSVDANDINVNINIEQPQQNVTVNTQEAIRRVQSIISQYDFLLVVERMDESLVALSFRMGVPLGDVLVASSKVAGASYMPVGPDGSQKKCIRLESSPKTLPDSIAQFFRGSVWHAMNYGDYLLHFVTDASLDRTIEAIGKIQFQERLQAYRQLKTDVHRHCAKTIQLPCSSNGTLQLERAAESCYIRDIGCGHECFDAYLEGKSSMDGNW